MALIRCPECGKEISDKAARCPVCGFELGRTKGIAPKKEQAGPDMEVCKECGTKFEKGARSCPNCGCPVEGSTPQGTEQNNEKEQIQKVEVASISLRMNRQKKRMVLVAGVACLAIILAILLIRASLQKANRESYQENLNITATAILKSASEAEGLGNLIKTVWYNSIFEEKDSSTDKYTRRKNSDGTFGKFYEDFNDALSNLFADEAYTLPVSELKHEQEKIRELMKELQTPPDEYKEAYQAIQTLYKDYSEFIDLVISPSGSYQTFRDDFREMDSKVSSSFENMKLYLNW